MPEETDPPQPTPADPTIFGGVSPDEMIARAMQTARLSTGTGHWEPPSIEEAAHLFPGYAVLKLIGRGGMGAVYQARQIELDRLVAIKLLPLEVSVDRDFADRFRREARAMAKLHHPNIVTVFDFGTTCEGHLFFVMEYVAGANLADIIHQVGLDDDQALSVAEQVCTALAYAHGKGVVHRDIKPANVMIDTESHVKVADFGLARLTDPSAEQMGTTVTGTVMGTPDYMAPEQTQGMNVDHRADIYSLGVMLYEMLCRQIPKGIFQPPSARIGCDARIDQIVIKAMQQAPEHRYQSTTEMKADVTAARTPPSIVPTGPTQIVHPHPVVPPVRPTPPQAAPAPALPAKALPARVRKRSGLRLYVGLAVAVVAVLAGAAFFGKPRAGGKKDTPAAPGGSDPVAASLAAATKEQPFVNTLGMKFVPVPITGGPTGGKKILFSIWETRRRDYQEFVAATDKYNVLPKPIWEMDGFEETRDHPAVMVNRYNAAEFCTWLTKVERASGKIPKDAVYRLPKDHEWSCAVGIGDLEDPAESPREKSGVIKRFYWSGVDALPPPGAGNFYGEEAASVPYGNVAPLKGYRDAFPRTAPVGSFKANALGLYDLEGNVCEWCEEVWSDPEKSVFYGALRGACWWRKDPNGTAYYTASTRPVNAKSASFNWNGFRVVLELSALPSSPPTALPTPAATPRAQPATPAPPPPPQATPQPVPVVPPIVPSKTAAAATKDQPFVNSLGMKFVPVEGTKVLFSAWETRVQDYEVFANETKREWPKAKFPQGPTHPAVTVSWEDAVAFCEWLSKREGRKYRLPTDAEWSFAVGLGEEKGNTPKEKAFAVAGYPWGKEWPPPQGTGNYGPDYAVDSFEKTAPVGSFAANPAGLHDLSGNVAEWCDDWFDGQQTTRVLRGSSWVTSPTGGSFMKSSSRKSESSKWRYENLGFRCVLMAGGS